MKLTYSYNLNGPATFVLALLIIIFALLMAFLAYSEQDNIIGISLGFPAGLMVYGLIASGSFYLAFWLIAQWHQQKSNQRVICIEDHAVTLPLNVYSRAYVTLPFNEIDDVSYVSASRIGLKVIQLKHHGKVTQISDLGFSSQSKFFELYEQLRNHVQ